MELEHLRIACGLMRRHGGRQPEEILAPRLPNVPAFEPGRGWVRELPDTQLGRVWSGDQCCDPRCRIQRRPAHKSSPAWELSGFLS